ncbi:MAG: radical SAM protein [Bdellovibrionales bacterium]|nr:radical SAM protein [Bdellovibrionales bacterium]
MTNFYKDEHYSDEFPNHKLVYGPVKSWRFGQSLGIDPIFKISTCSFNCIYCQLGNIQQVSSKLENFVPTEKILIDFENVLNDGKTIDVITYSGSGEPTLASNLEEIIDGIRKLAPHIPQYILTNGTHLGIASVQKTLNKLDKVIVKLDAWDDRSLSLINRADKGINFSSLIEGILSFTSQYKGSLEVQTMFMPINIEKDLKKYAETLMRINPETVQLNTPKRPYPLSWHRENRGNHLGIHHHEIRELKTITSDQAKKIEKELKEMTGLNILSIYR